MRQKKSLDDVSQLIARQIEFKGELQKARKAAASKQRSEKGVFLLFKKLINRYPANPEVLKSFLDFLQSLNSEDLIKQFSLKDITRFYKRLSETNKFDVELNLDFFYFMYNVLDNEAGTLKLYTSYKKSILASFEKFEKRVGG